MEYRKKPKLRPIPSQLHLFQAHFDQLLNPDHPLVVLAKKIDWSRFHIAMEDSYSPDLGAPAKSVRLIVGLLYLKPACNLSDGSPFTPENQVHDFSASTSP